MAIQEILLRLLEMLGIKQSDSAKWEKLIEKLRTQKASNVDALEGLKDEIKTLESIDFKITGLMQLYNKAMYDLKYRRQVIPENLMQFDLYIYVTELRNFKP